MELPIRNGDLVCVGTNTGIDGHIARVIRVNDLAGTALVETKKVLDEKSTSRNFLTATRGQT